MHDESRPKTGHVVIWDVEPEGIDSSYWVGVHDRNARARLFDGAEAWVRARAAAFELAGPDGTVWKRHKDGRFQRLSEISES